MFVYMNTDNGPYSIVIFYCLQGKMYLDLCFDINPKDDEDIAEELKKSRNIVAVESSAYFKAYKPTLEALKSMDLEQIHFRLVQSY